jgi:integrase
MAKAKLPPGVRKRGNRFEVHVMRRGVRRTTTAGTLDEAMAAKGRLLQELGDTRASTRPTLAWALNLAGADWTGKWGEIGRLYANEFMAKVGGPATLVSEVSQQKVDDYITGLEKQGLSDATINRRLAVVSKMFRVVHKRGGPSGPYIQRRKERNGRIRFLSDLEEQALLANLRHIGRDDAADVAVVLMDTGMRVGELWSVQTRDVDLGRRVVSLWRTKADMPRTIPLTKRVTEILERWVADARSGDTIVPIPRVQFEGAWHWARGHMKLDDDPQFVPHVLRHTFASRLVQRGASIAKVQQLMGHKTISITMRYAHLAPDHLTDAVALLEAQSVHA